MSTPSQRRCLMTSTMLHGGLLGAMVLLAAFSHQAPPPPPQPYIILVPTAPVTGGPTGGGELPAGQPDRQPPPPADPPRVLTPPAVRPPVVATPPSNIQPPPVVTPPTVTPKTPIPPPERVIPKLPIKPQDVDPNRSDSVKKIDTSPKIVRTPTVDRKKQELADRTARQTEAREAKAEADRNAKAEADRNAKAEARNRAERERYERDRRDALNSAVNGLGRSIAGTTKIEVPGPGGGGAVTLSYADYVQSVFQSAWNRNRPSTLAAKSAQARVSLTIRRDGSFTYRVLSNSRIGEVDAAIGRILSQQRRLNPFPADLKGEDLEIIITFNLESSVSG